MKNKLQNFNKKYLAWIIFGLIILTAIFFRFYKLNSLPPGVFTDEAANGLDIFRILQNQDYRIIYDTNGPREALFFYMQAVFVYFMGNTGLALRMAPALMGVVSVIAVFFATKEWTNRRTALFASFLFAISPWVVIIQRDGFRASLVPLFVALVLLFAAKAYTKGKYLYYILAGVFMGLGFYTYNSFSMMLVVMVLGVVYLVIMRRKWLMQNWKKLLLSLAVFGITAIPIIYANIKLSENSFSRSSDVSFLNKDLNKGQPVQALLSSTAKTLLQYNFYGDENSRHNIPGQPYLNTFVGLMFILGIVVSVYNFKKPRYAFLLIILSAMLLPTILSASAIPHGLRSIGTAVPVFMLVGVGANYMLFIWYKTFPVNRLARIVGVTIICVLLALSLVQAYRQYFLAWAQDEQTFKAYNESANTIAKYLIKNNQSSIKNYIVINEYESMPIKYLTNGKGIEYALLDNQGLANLPIQKSQKAIIIVPNDIEYQKQIEIIKAKFPNAKSTEVKSDLSGKLLFSVYEVSQ